MAAQVGYTGPLARYGDAYFTGLEGDVEFYRGLAVAAGSPVLEVGCGTGRILLPLAAAGVRVTGVDSSRQMLARAKARLSGLSVPAAVARRVRLVAADMRRLPPLGGPFRLAVLAYRTFQHLLTAEDQVRALDSIRGQLARGGRLALNQYDPGPARPAAACTSTPEPQVDGCFTDPASGRRVRVRYRRNFDPKGQVMRQELWFDSLDAGRVAATETAALCLRCTGAAEMEALLRGCGFRVLSLWGDFAGAPFPGRGEQVWVAERR